MFSSVQFSRYTWQVQLPIRAVGPKGYHRRGMVCFPASPPKMPQSQGSAGRRARWVLLGSLVVRNPTLEHWVRYDTPDGAPV